MHNGVFVLLALLKLTSIFHPSPHTGFRQFPEGISKLKQVTGREHRDIQHYLVATIADCVLKDFLIAIHALADFRYLSQAPEISDEVCTRIDDVLQEFQDHKDCYSINLLVCTSG